MKFGTPGPRDQSHLRPQHISRFRQSQEDSLPQISPSNRQIRTLTGNAGTAPVALVGRVTWDGIGNAVGSATENIGGAVTHATFVGTYKVNSDCTGSKTFTFADGLVPIVHFDFVITDGGNEIQVISTDPGLTLTASQHR